MEQRKVAALLSGLFTEIAQVFEGAAAKIEEQLAADGDEKPAKTGKGKGKGKEDEAPEADDVVAAARGAMKVIGRPAVEKIIKKVGKAEKSAEVDAELRQDVIDALEKAVEDADESDDD